MAVAAPALAYLGRDRNAAEIGHRTVSLRRQVFSLGVHAAFSRPSRARLRSTPKVAGEVAVLSGPPVAGDRHRQGVGRAGPRHRTRRPGSADRAGDVGVAGGRSGRNPSQRFPDPHLERRTADVERQVQSERRGFDEAYHLGDQAFEIGVATNQVRSRKTVLKVPGEAIWILADQDGANAFAASGDQDRAQRALADREADVRRRSAGAVVAGGDAEHLVGVGVETAVGIEAGVINGFGHGAAARQFIPHAARPVRGGVGPGRHARDRLEDPVKMEGAEVRRPSQFREAWRLFGRLDGPAGLGHGRGVLLGERRLVGLATPAGAKASRLGFGRGWMEADVLRIREPGGGAAIDSGRRHRIEESAIRRPVTPHDPYPSRIALAGMLSLRFIVGRVSIARLSRSFSVVSPHLATCRGRRTPALAFKSGKVLEDLILARCDQAQTRTASSE